MEKIKEPLVSVIVPVYNVALYLEDCLNSIINQTYDKLEIILVDDGSTDNSGEICDRYAQRDERFQVIHQQNKGLSGARNAGMDICTGEYVTFVDSDDFIDHEMIETMLREALENQIDIVLCGTVTCDQKGVALGSSMINHSEIYREELFQPFFLNKYYFVAAWGKLYHRTVIDSVRFPDRKYHEDMFVAHEFLHLAKSVMILNKAFYWYRQTDGSITRRGFQLKHLDAIEACLERSLFVEENAKSWLDESNATLVYTCCKCVERMFASAYKDKEREKTIQDLVRSHLRVLVQNKRYSIYTKVFAIIYSISPKLMRLLYTTIKH